MNITVTVYIININKVDNCHTNLINHHLDQLKIRKIT